MEQPRPNTPLDNAVARLQAETTEKFGADVADAMLMSAGLQSALREFVRLATSNEPQIDRLKKTVPLTRDMAGYITALVASIAVLSGRKADEEITSFLQAASVYRNALDAILKAHDDNGQPYAASEDSPPPPSVLVATS